MSNKLKIVYMGTPDFAVPPLKALVEEGYSVNLVVTQPDKKSGRGKKIKPTPVKIAAQEMGIELVQPEKIKNNSEFMEKLYNINPDIIIVAAYGKILPVEICKMPKLGCINIHASLLPKYRGAAPIQRVIMEGEEVTGITLMYMEEGLDTGDMIAKMKTEVKRKTADELHDELSIMGAKLLIKYLPKIAIGDISPEVQNDKESCYAHMIDKKDGFLDFSRDCVELERLVRGVSAYSYLNGEQLKIKKADIGDDVEELPGTVIKADKDGITVACGKGSLVIKELQLPGKKAMGVDAYLRGHNLSVGTHLGI